MASRTGSDGVADARTLDQKLMAVATQDASPTERDNARAILTSRGLWPPPVTFGDGVHVEPDLRPDRAWAMPGTPSGPTIIYGGRYSAHKRRG